MGETDDTPSYGGVSCIFTGCENTTSSCTYTCFTPGNPFLFPPPPPFSASSSSPSQNHIAPFLIATVSILGISFLLLSTCTIILRLRFTRRRRGVSPENSDESPIEDDQSFVDHPIWHITTIGLQQSVIDSITAFKYNKIDGFFVDGSDSTCSVCLTEFEEGDDLRLLPKCSHAFHISCIDTWLRSHKNCPLCRAPIVNESQSANFGVGQLNLSNSNSREEFQGMNLDDFNGVLVSQAGEGSSHRFRERGDILGELPMLEGTSTDDILKKNHELRILSDLGENHRFQVLEEGLEPVRRSISLNAIATCGAVATDEGCSRDGNSGIVLQKKKIGLVKGGNRRGSSMSGLLIKSSSIGRSLQKGPVSMKRSLSSSSKFFSFRRTKSQASILPL